MSDMYSSFNCFNFFIIIMYHIIVEKSQSVIQVVSVYKNKSTQSVRDTANAMHDENVVDDYDVLRFNSEEDLNDYLLQHLYI